MVRARGYFSSSLPSYGSHFTTHSFHHCIPLFTTDNLDDQLLFYLPLPHLSYPCLLIHSSFSYFVVPGRFFHFSCSHFSRTHSSHLDHPTSQVHHFPLLLEANDAIHLILHFFPDHSYKQSPASLKFLFANHVDIQLCQLMSRM